MWLREVVGGLPRLREEARTLVGVLCGIEDLFGINDNSLQSEVNDESSTFSADSMQQAAEY